MAQLKGEEKDEAFRNSDWGADSTDSMIAQVENYKVPFGCTLGDLIKATPREYISKVFFEEKIFETWTHGRIALIGDGKSCCFAFLFFLRVYASMSIGEHDRTDHELSSI